MKSLSIYTLTRNQSIEHISKLERQLSGRKFPLKIRTWEWGSMRALAAQLEMHMQEVYSLRFFYSFQIPRLGKEFDLLQIKDNHIVNIELKSGVVSDQAIRKQLIQNRYYLSVLGRPIQSYTYISSQNRLVRLTHHDHIVDADWERLCEDLQKEGTNYEGNIEDLFRAELYLISPITDPVRFLKKEYFLTSQQRDIEKKILRDIYAKQSGCFWFSGIPGTGKTLLLYDIAMKLSVRHRICMVHCEENGEKWRILHERLQRIDFLADEQIRIKKKSGSQNSGQYKGPDSSRDYEQRKQFNCEERKAGTQIPLEKYRGILVDEAHLLSRDKIERLLELSKEQPVIFSSDSEDVISSEEMDKENIKKLENQTDIKVFRLTNRIRTNAELSTFIQNMMHLPPRMNSRGYPHIFVVYANDDVWGYGGKTNKSYLIAKYVDRWHPANITDDPYNPATQWVAGYYPALRHNFSNTSDNGSRWNYGISVWLPQATYLRLKSMEIGYNLPKSFMKRIGVNSARIFVNGSNLLTFCNKALKDADPEREERDWGANLAYPLMRTYNFGLNINF